MTQLTKAEEARQRVEELQAALSQMEQYEAPTEHIFHGGMYCRQVFRHAGVTIVGKVHKKEHFYFVVFGTILVTTDDGVQELTGPALLCSMPGTKRAVYAVTDALCMTIHRVDSTDVATVEDELVEPDPKSMFTVGNKVKPKELV